MIWRLLLQYEAKTTFFCPYYQFAFTIVQIKFIIAAPLAQTAWIPLKQLAIPDAFYRHKKF
jgi:hypothetical protein